MTCPSSFCNETCPAPVGTVNLVTNELSLEGDDIHFVHEVVVPVGSTITLPNGDLPVDGTFQLFRNGQLLTESVDFTITDDTVTLLIAPEVDDIWVVAYLTAD